MVERDPRDREQQHTDKANGAAHPVPRVKLANEERWQAAFFRFARPISTGPR